MTNEKNEEQKEEILQKPRSRMIFFLILGFIFLLAFAVLFFTLSSKEEPKEDTIGKLINCMQGKTIIFYGTDTCPVCQKQKELFGERFDKIMYVNCHELLEFCNAEKIRKVPTWLINGEHYVGYKSAEELMELIEC